MRVVLGKKQGDKRKRKHEDAEDDLVKHVFKYVGKARQKALNNNNFAGIKRPEQRIKMKGNA